VLFGCRYACYQEVHEAVFCLFCTALRRSLNRHFRFMRNLKRRGFCLLLFVYVILCVIIVHGNLDGCCYYRTGIQFLSGCAVVFSIFVELYRYTLLVMHPSLANTDAHTLQRNFASKKL